MVFLIISFYFNALLFLYYVRSVIIVTTKWRNIATNKRYNIDSVVICTVGSMLIITASNKMENKIYHTVETISKS